MKGKRLKGLFVACTVLGLTASMTVVNIANSNGSDTTSASTLRVAMAEVGSTLDPATYQVPSNYINMAGTMGYLIGYGFKQFPNKSQYSGSVPIINANSYIPELATSWKISADGKSVSMRLRRGVKSPYGNELSAKDLVWTTQRNLALKSVGNFGMTVSNIDKSNPLTVVDNYNVVWNLTAPSPLIEKVLAWSWFAPFDSTEAKKHATSDDPWAVKWLTTHTAFYGPYTVTDFTPGQSATMVVNPNYYGTKPDIKQITFQSVPDPGNRQQLLQRGDVDFVPDLPRGQLVLLKSDKSVEITFGPSTRFSYLHFNVNKAPWNDVRVRQAVAYAIPYNQILSDVYHGSALPAKSVATWLPGADPTAYPYVLNLTKAKALLAQAGLASGFTANLTYSMANPGPENEQAAILIQSSLAQIGIKINLVKPTSEATFTTTYNTAAFELAIAGMSPGAPDAGYAVFNLANSKGFQNFTKFKDAALDAATNAALASLSGPQHNKAVKESQRLYGQLVPAALIADPLVGLATTPKFGNLRLGSWGFPIWKDATLSK